MMPASAYTKTWENYLFYRFKIQADGYYNKVKDKIIAYSQRPAVPLDDAEFG